MNYEPIRLLAFKLKQYVQIKLTFTIIYVYMGINGLLTRKVKNKQVKYNYNCHNYKGSYFRYTNILTWETNNYPQVCCTV